MSENKDCEEAKPFLNEEHEASPRHSTRIQRFNLLPWTVSLVSWLISIYLLLSRTYQTPQPATSVQNATSGKNSGRIDGIYFPTDLEAMRSVISYEPRVFTGALYYDESAKKFIRNATVDGPEYFGPPSEAIDAAWEEIFHNEWAPLTEEEAAPFQPELTRFPGRFGKMFMFEPDMLHSLHCLNEIRKHIDAEYYRRPEHASDVHIDQWDWDRIHIDHCLDQLRQTIMCFGDLSPVPLYWVEGAPLGLGRGSTHTCRKWEPIKQWVDQRIADGNSTRSPE